MRKVLACERCRSSKVKCRHQGSPPCENCTGKSYEVLCALSLPLLKRITRPPASRTDQPESSGESHATNTEAGRSNVSSNVMEATPGDYSSASAKPSRRGSRTKVEKPPSSTGLRGNKETSMCQAILRATSEDPPTPTPINLLLSNNLPSDPEMVTNSERLETMAEVISEIPEAALQLVITQMSSSFPELAFLHMPSLLHNVKATDPLVTCSLLDLFTSFNQTFDSGPFSDWLGTGSRFVKKKIYGKIMVKELLSPNSLLYAPSIEVVQALVILALSYWGKGDYFMCWMLQGNASRMLQAFGFCLPPSGLYSEDSSYNNDWHMSSLGELDSEILCRTYWSCFMIDRITAFGNNRSFAFSKCRYEKVPLPHDKRSFALMTNLTCAQPLTDIITIKSYNDQVTFRHSPHTVGEHAIYIKIFSIWGEINEYLMQGGRYSQSLPPWDQNSVNYKIHAELKKWWGSLPIHWRWTSERLTLHQTMGTDTIFTMSNCLYHLCVTYLNREHLPFLPHSIECPSGPTEEPLLPDPPDEEYWTASATECFQSTRSLSSILNTLHETEVKEELGGSYSSRTTNGFYCFCAFVASIESMYGTKFYWMNPTTDSHSPSLETCYMKMISFLKVKKETVKVAQNWLKIANRVMELYDFVAKNREQAAELNLGRNNLRQLVDLVQLVNTGTTRESLDRSMHFENQTARREGEFHVGDHLGFNIEDLDFFLMKT
ncbi:LADA_0A00144g1_1 [Lachancea dasiensis]|uniref:LADA_0A00144g1_1 n=1 Tax=Lachancea dasiensis TaxID=1072105 RepID=A0A1G4ILZ2_9SACH|nr:LADA_0A00144g1_1 [Lachancea dasiensis]